MQDLRVGVERESINIKSAHFTYLVILLRVA